jgi:hypothetical protein
MRITARPPLSRAACASSGLAVVAALGFASACSTPTTETNVWKSSSYSAGPMKKIAVFGGKMNETDRRTLEDAFVGALARYGTRATPSYAIFANQTPPPDQAAIRTTLQSAGYDGALVSTLKGIQDQVYVAPDTDWAGGFYGAYWGAPAYVQTDQFVKFETTLWDPGSGKMVWSTTTQTENPSSNKDFDQSLLKTVVPSMAKAGLLPMGQPVALGSMRSVAQ